MIGLVVSAFERNLVEECKLVTSSPREQRRHSEENFQLTPVLSSIFPSCYLKTLLPGCNNIVQLLISRVHKPEADTWGFWPVVCQYISLITEGSLSESQPFFKQYFGALQGSMYLLPRKSLSLKYVPQSRFVTPFFKRLRVGGEGKSFPTTKTHPPEETSVTAPHFYQNSSLAVCTIIRGRQWFSVPRHLNRCLIPQTIYSSERRWGFQSSWIFSTFPAMLVTQRLNVIL